MVLMVLMVLGELACVMTCRCCAGLCLVQVFAVFGVNLFSASVPSAFGDLTVALYTLFICITQDGWMTIYKEFQQ